jgi:cyanuric acid amidohydrolase
MRTYCTGYKVTMSAPDDTSQLEGLLDRGEFRAEEIVCIICKTEGNGRVNDFSRPLAHRCFRDVIGKRTNKPAEVVDNDVAFVMSGGCEGIIAPHATIFVKRNSTKAPPSKPQKRLTFATANTRELLPEELGSEVHVRLVAEAVKAARASANIGDLADIHYVQVKCPLLTSQRINDAKSRGRKTITEDTLRSMGFSNGASALGIALGLGEIEDIDPRDICTNAEIYTTRGAAPPGSNL